MFRKVNIIVRDGKNIIETQSKYNIFLSSNLFICHLYPKDIENRIVFRKESTPIKHLFLISGIHPLY